MVGDALQNVLRQEEIIAIVLDEEDDGLILYRGMRHQSCLNARTLDQAASLAGSSTISIQ
jgi:hypothetical protein